MSCQPEGWRMVDRFYGFRYEISGPNIYNVNYEESAKHEADLLGCFGWIQKSKFSNTLVGEARCNKIQGPKFQEWLSRGPTGAIVTNFQTKIYSDTKIRLHFSSFKVLDNDRDTCFLDQPHQCPEFVTSSAGASTTGTGGGTKSHTEL